MLKRTVKGTTIRLRVNVPAAGRVVITGNGLTRLTLRPTTRGTYTMTVHLTKKAKNRLKLKRKLKLTIRVRYVPVAGRTSTVKVKLTVKA